MSAFSMSDYRAFTRGPRFAYPGGGDLCLLLSDGELLCHGCAYTERRQVVWSLANHASDGWRPVAMVNTYNEDPSVRLCAHCGADIGDQGEEDNEE
jgi:hypothetical protein